MTTKEEGGSKIWPRGLWMSRPLNRISRIYNPQIIQIVNPKIFMKFIKNIIWFFTLVSQTEIYCWLHKNIVIEFGSWKKCLLLLCIFLFNLYSAHTSVTSFSVGFKAHKSYNNCLENRNDTLMLAFKSMENIPDVLPENISYSHPVTGITITTTLQNCSLQKELDNVIIFFTLYGKKNRLFLHNV